MILTQMQLKHSYTRRLVRRPLDRQDDFRFKFHTPTDFGDYSYELAGKKVGVTAPSHAVISNLLDEVFRAADEARRTLRVVQKPSQKGENCERMVILGDPQQLDQPRQGVHPEGCEVSALDHLLAGAQTISTVEGQNRRYHH